MITTNHKLLAPPIIEDKTKNRAAKILFQIQLLTLGLFGLTFVLSAFYGYLDALTILSVGFVFVIFTMYVNHLKLTEFASILLLCGFLIIINYLAFIGRGIHDEVIIAFPILVMLSSVLLTQLFAVIITSLTILSLTFLTWAELNNFIETGLNSTTSLFDFLTTALLILFTAVIMHTFMRTLTSAIIRSQKSEDALKIQTKALKISEARWRSFTQFSPVRILTTSRKGLIEFVNIDETDPDYAKVIGKSIFDFILPEDHASLQNIIDEVLLTQQVIHYETKGFNIAGDIVWYDIYLGSIIEENEATTLLFNVVDISEKKEIELQLKHSEHRLRTFVSQSSEAIWMVEYKPPIPTTLPANEQANLMLDREFVSECNQAGSEIYGFDHPENVIGLATRTIRGEENDDLAIASALEFIENGYEFIARESMQELPSGKPIYFLTNTIGIVEDGFLTGTWGSERDITTIREAEQFLRKHMQELERSNRELEQFAYVASHDLQEPLRKIQMLSSRLTTRYAETLDRRGIDYLNRMQNASARMQNLIEDLLAYSHVSNEKRPFTTVNLNTILQTVLADLEPHIQQEQATIHLSPLPNVYGDGAQLTQLLQNLVSNAIKFHKKGVAPIVTINCDRLEDEYRIKIIDNGIGFEEKYSERIFTMFQRLHSRKEYEGTGVGLAICRRIVEQHGGKISARSQIGQGATFIIQLPIQEEKQDE